MSQAKVIFADSKKLTEILPEKSVDLVVTGPPYWNEVVYSNDDGQLSKIKDYQEFLLELSEVWLGCSKVLKEGGILALWVHDFLREDRDSLFKYTPFHSDILKTFDDSLTLRNVYVWDRYLNKDRGQISNLGHGIGTRVQYILILQKKGQSQNEDKIKESLRRIYWEPVWYKKTAPKFLGSTTLFKAIFGIGKLTGFKSLGASLQKIKAVKDGYKFGSYPTECPEDVSRMLIELFSSPGDTVLDPFAGSGTTLKSAVNLKRHSIGIEINKNSEKAIRDKLGGLVTFC